MMDEKLRLQLKRKDILMKLLCDLTPQRNQFGALFNTQVTWDLPKDHRNVCWIEESERILNRAVVADLLPEPYSDWKDGKGESLNLALYGWVPGLACVQVRKWSRADRDERGRKEVHFLVTDANEVCEVPEQLVLEGITTSGVKVQDPFPVLRPHLSRRLASKVHLDPETFPLPLCPMTIQEIDDYLHPLYLNLSWMVAKGEPWTPIRAYIAKHVISKEEADAALAWSLLWADAMVTDFLLDLGADPDPLFEEAHPALVEGLANLEQVKIRREAGLNLTGEEDRDILL